MSLILQIEKKVEVDKIEGENDLKPKVETSKKVENEKEVKQKRKTNRFNGISEEEIAKKGLPDYLRQGLDMVFIGINPSLFAAYTGKYYDGPGNHFWKALYLSGLIPEPMNPDDDHKLLDMGIGFTNIVPRTTRGIADLTKQEIADGAKVLLEKLNKYKPKVAVFNGKQIYQVYSGQKKFMFGRQPDPLFDGKTWVWVMPSSSARCAQLPRAIDKVPFYDALRKFRDHLSGKLPKIDECEVTFANVVLTNWPSKNSIKKEEAKEKECLISEKVTEKAPEKAQEKAPEKAPTFLAVPMKVEKTPKKPKTPKMPKMQKLLKSAKESIEKMGNVTNGKKGRVRSCGKCEGCKREKCSNCAPCRNPKLKQKCKAKVCLDQKALQPQRKLVESM